jgi:hypothetical protein
LKLQGSADEENGGKSQRMPGSRNTSNLMIEGKDIEARMTYQNQRSLIPL